MPRKITLVTGATGFIGSHLVDYLLKNSSKPIKVLVLKKQKVQIVYGDIRNKKSLKKLMDGVNLVYHLAAISRPMNVDTSVYYDTNVKGTLNLLELLKNKKIKRFVHVSTVSVLGLSPDGHPLKEDEFQEEKMDYGLSKRQGEQDALKYSKKHNIPIAVIRPCLMYGPRCEVRRIMFKYTKKGIFPLIDNGKAKMEFCYVANLIQALVEASHNKKAVGEVFNITDGQAYSIKKVLNTIADEYEVSRPKINLPYGIAKVLGICSEFASKIAGIHPPFSRTAADWMSNDVNVYDCSKAKKILNYKPAISLREGVRRSIEWYEKNN